MNDFIFEIGISSDYTGFRLDAFLCAEFPEKSRSFFNRLIKDGQVQVNNQHVKSGYSLRENDMVYIVFPQEKEISLAGQDIDFSVVYEDDYIIAVNKPAGIVVHPADTQKDGTLLNGLIYRKYQLSPGNDSFRPGIIHRIDKDTSGLLLVAKNEKAHHLFSRLFHDRKIEKYYLAYVWGRMNPVQGEIDVPIGRNQKNRIKMSVNGMKAKSALTKYEVISDYQFVSYLKVRIITGRTHQIRAHFSSVNHPVLGDTLYSNYSDLLSRIPPLYKSKYYPVLKKINRQMLHSWKMIFQHPFLQKKVELTAPLPPDFSNLSSCLSE